MSDIAVKIIPIVITRNTTDMKNNPYASNAKPGLSLRRRITRKHTPSAPQIIEQINLPAISLFLT
jgi:hypothetical protein